MAYYSFGGWKGSLFGDTHMYGPEGINFYTRGKVVTSRWPDPATSAIDLGLHLVAKREELREVVLTAPNAYRLEVSVPTKRNLVAANNRVFVRFKDAGNAVRGAHAWVRKEIPVMSSMRSRAESRWPLALAAVLVAACGGGSSDAPKPAGGLIRPRLCSTRPWHRE